MAEPETSTEPAAPAEPAPPQVGGIKPKILIIIAVVTAVIWAFTLNTGSTVLLIIVSVLSAVLVGVLLYAWRMIGRQRNMLSLLHGATTAEGRQTALAKLSEGKDAGSPTNLFARAQLMAADEPKAALELLQGVELRTFPGAMQDDVSLLKTQLLLSFGRTQDARKCADSMNLDNPARKEVRAMGAVFVAEAWARTGKPKEALALLDTVEKPKKDGEQIMLQAKVARVFARFAANQRSAAQTELGALADVDINYLGRFLAPQYRVHPELQKLARAVAERHPAARRRIKVQGKR